MSLKEALEAIREVNEPLAVVLAEIIDRQDQLDHNQTKVLEGLIEHLMTPPGNPSQIDLSFLISILNKHKKN